ncbi:MAG: response regulator [Myxococcales bacterium]|nr:response regulator [Myxococcales bacterium]
MGAVERPRWEADDARVGLRRIAVCAERLTMELKLVRESSERDAVRIDEILDVLFAMARLDFSGRAVVTDDRGRLDALAAACNMLSEELQASLRQNDERNRELQTALKAKSQFLANMSHEIRTPLGAMLGFADLLLGADLSESESLNGAQVIRRNGEHLLAVINDILDLSKIEAGQLRVEKVEFSLPALLSEVDSLMRPRATEKGLEFSTDIRGELPETLVADPFRIRQILLNLVGNAIKFTEKGSVKIEVGSTDGRLVFDVIDTGIGMTKAATKNLFKPFQQADASMSRRFGGTGLGLAICKSLADALNGTITLESEAGRGSRFLFEMMAEVSEGTEMVSSWGTALPNLDSQRSASRTKKLAGNILLAEDGVDNQVLATSILRRAGLQVTVAENGAIAVERAKAAMEIGLPFDLIVMDMQMPELDGYGATAMLREHGYRGPVIALTAHAMTGEKERCLAAGCDDYLSKPFDRRELVRMVGSHLDTPHARRTGLVSTFADDPDMFELVNEFVASLPERIERMYAACERGDVEELRRLAHHIKGAAGGYGFQPITDAASKLEEAVDTSDLAKVTRALERLTALCNVAEPVGSHCI